MNREYRVIFTPLQPWFFGEERTYSFGLGNKTLRYFVRSSNTPQMTTLIGAIKYAILGAGGFSFKNDWSYDQNEREILAKIAGKGTFPIADAEKMPDFLGAIKSISPLLLWDGGSFWFPAPIDHVEKSQSDGKQLKTYHPLRIKSCPDTSDNFNDGGLVFADYNPKEGTFKGWMNLDSRECRDEKHIFGDNVRTGLRIDDTEGTFHRQEFKYFKDQKFKFCVLAQISSSETLDGYCGQVMMGGKGALFQVEFQEVSKGEGWDQLKDRIRDTLFENQSNEGTLGLRKIVALSDFFPQQLPLPNQFSLAAYELKSFRSIVFQADSMAKNKGNMEKNVEKLRDRKAHTLVKAGAVIYFREEDESVILSKLMSNPAGLRLAGYNWLVY